MAELTVSLYPPDNEIIIRIHARDGTAELDLVSKHGGLIVSIARKHGLGKEDADEVANDVLLETIEQARSGNLKAPTLRAWLRRVTKNRVIDRYRRNETVREHDEAVVEELRLAVDWSSTDQDEQSKGTVYPYKLVVVRQAIMRLREREAKRGTTKPDVSDVQVLVWIAHRVSNEELAEYLGTNENTARQRRHRALERLKEEMIRLQEELSQSAEEL